jgi:hypothetical protein
VSNLQDLIEPSEEVKAMARRCAAKYWQTGDPSDEATARSILSGEWDDQAYTQAALTAILETQRRDDAALTSTSGEEMRLREALEQNRGPLADAARQIAIRFGVGGSGQASAYAHAKEAILAALTEGADRHD